MKKLLLAVPVMLLGASMTHAQIVSVPTTTLNLTVGAESAIVVGTTPGFSTSTAFAAYTTTTPFTYYIRTSGSGSGAITVKFASDWAGTGGPSITAPPTTGDYLSYANTVSSPGTAGTAGNITATGTAYSVAAFTSSAASAIGGNTGSVAWSLVNDPNYKQGSYSVTATFTISAT
jgi:hypothetical protein